MEESQQFSPEQYKIEVLKQRISSIVANYEDQISSYETNLAFAKQEIERLKEQVDGMDGQVVEPDAPEADATD